jgi:hypothetical protein
MAIATARPHQRLRAVRVEAASDSPFVDLDAGLGLVFRTGGIMTGSRVPGALSAL